VKKILEKNKNKALALPKVGDIIYVPTSLYLSHGRDDFEGGKAIVHRIEKANSSGKKVHMVAIKERNGYIYNWESYLAKNQKEWKKKYGDKIAHHDPDYSEDSNRDD
jgi:hypothetical protein